MVVVFDGKSLARRAYHALAPIWARVGGIESLLSSPAAMPAGQLAMFD